MAGSRLCSRKVSWLAAWITSLGDGREVRDRWETTPVFQEEEGKEGTPRCSDGFQ